MDRNAPSHERVLALLEGEPDGFGAYGFADVERAVRDFEDLIEPIGELRMPERLLHEFFAALDPGLALSNFDRLSRSVFSKRAFLAELNTRPEICRLLVRLLGSSHFLSDILVREPE